MKTKILTTVLVLLSLGLFAQVGVNADGSSPLWWRHAGCKINNKGYKVLQIN